jgi:hypothetical protein
VDLREKLDKTGRGQDHDKTDYRRTRYVPNKMDGQHTDRPKYRHNNNNRYNSNNNSTPHHGHHSYRPAPRQFHQPVVQRREPKTSGSNSRSSNHPVTGAVAGLTRGTPHSPIRAPVSAVALSLSPDPSKTDFRVRERGATKIMETLRSKDAAWGERLGLAHLLVRVYSYTTGSIVL